MRELTTWRAMISSVMEDNGEAWSSIESITLTDDELDRKFDAGYGCENGAAFTAWTANFVYFPLCYDGSEWCGSVSRNPNGVATQHQGG